MCKGHNHRHSPAAARAERAISLDCGSAHDADHRAWSRRDFLVRSTIGATAGAVLLGSTPVRALGSSPLFDALAQADTDRVLVLVQLTGGNDGLNTIIPVQNDLYYSARPTLAIAANQTFALDGEHGLHPSLAALQNRWGNGDFAIVNGVGYGSPSLSHFRSTDIWMSGSSGDEVVETGWAGRSLAREFPDFLTAPPLAPPAVQIGTSSPLMFAGQDAGYGMAMLDVDRFLDIASGGEIYPTNNVPATPAGSELAFIRGIANSAFRYRDAIFNASQAAGPAATYPDTDLGAELSAVARLIKGGLDTRIYHVAIHGFDTHGDQRDDHAELLQELGDALDAFYSDLGAAGHANRTLTMTFSEFGRRVEENGSAGTDHGTAAPLFMMGPAVQGGFFGEEPDLGALDDDGNTAHTTDFRQIYATVLQRWFGLSEQVSADVLGIDYAPLDVLATYVETGSKPASPTVTLAAPVPNPVSARARVSFTLPSASRAELVLFDGVGRRVREISSGLRSSGTHSAEVSVADLPSGVYVLRLRTPSAVASQRMTVVR